MSGISTCYSGPMPCSTMAISATCNQFSASVIHDVWIWLVSRRSKQPLIMAAAVEGPLQRSSAKSNSNSSNLLHVKMLSAARLDCTGLRRDARVSPLRVCQHQRGSERARGRRKSGAEPHFCRCSHEFYLHAEKNWIQEEKLVFLCLVFFWNM